MEARRITLTTRDKACSDFRLEGKAAAITGAGSGIGRAIALEFAAHGAYIRILDLKEDDASATCTQITSAGGEASVHICDVTNQEQVKATFTEIFDRERLDILVNNAGISHVGTVEETTESDFDRILRVNVKGYYNCIQACVGHLKEKGGVILNMASIAGSSGLADRFAYSTSKGAVIAMTYSVARDYLHHNIRCNCISPARVHTPFVDDYLRKNYPGREQ
jgi:NAD(P)-dependent dehydrogenase (short-subunit alcohol dehydrogenase family)